MAYQDQFYTVGTVTVTNGSTAVTGSGTGWETALIVGGVFYAGGGAYPIQSVASETELTLAIPYVGVDAAGVGYAIDRQRAAAISNIAMNDRLAQIIREISIGNIEELNALDLIANQVLTTNAAGHLSQDALGTLGRALLALAAGNNTQYVQGDGTLQSKTELPISSATQTALNSKASLSGAGFTGRVTLSSPTGGQTTPEVRFNIGGQFQSSVYGENAAANGHGPSVVFYATAGSLGGTSWGIFNHYGNLTIPGALNAASKSFIIDHPLDPYNKDLVFASTESPHHGVEFWGTVRLENGSAIVDIDAASGLSPGTFEALTQRAVALQPNNLDSDTHVRCGHVVNGKFTIYASDPNCNDEVSWLVKAERNDVLVGTLPHTDPASGRLIPEQEKPEA
ncbi:hypothetical protein D7027_09870 [Ochrobactrum intermedium]|uniref:hypothetical protein n=1 Tax=Brucella intermedia TaxID=94625 RepID=UPI000FDF4B04|nr:hypothetical protein [Brucella intermedia]MPR62114.1 hypothetical protein [Brucella intermedia]